MLSLDSNWQNELWRSPYRLRFELNTGGANITQFTSAFDRARVLARAALGSATPVGIVDGASDPATEFFADPRRDWTGVSSFDALAELGVPTEAPEASWLGYPYPQFVEDPEINLTEHRAIRLTWDQADILLWNNIAFELGVRPSAPAWAKLIDRDRGVCVYAYDDRGMDITALTREAIADLYAQFDAWLLDYDRPRMLQAFS